MGLERVPPPKPSLLRCEGKTLACLRELQVHRPLFLRLSLGRANHVQRQGDRMLADASAIDGILARTEGSICTQGHAVFGTVPVFYESTHLVLTLVRHCDGIGAGDKAFDRLL